MIYDTSILPAQQSMNSFSRRQNSTLKTLLKQQFTRDDMNASPTSPLLCLYRISLRVKQPCFPDIPDPFQIGYAFNFGQRIQQHMQHCSIARLKVKYMLQQRQLRAHHEYAHNASAAFKYLKEMAVRFREYCVFLNVDVKRKVTVGEPGAPSAAVERRRQVLVSMGQTFQVADHEILKMHLRQVSYLTVKYLRQLKDPSMGAIYM